MWDYPKRCSKRTLTPMAISTMPPISSGLIRFATPFPKRMPRMLPVMLKTRETTPMTTRGMTSVDMDV